MNSSELNRIRREYTHDYRGSDLSTQHPWHPLNPVSIYYRHVQERLVSQFLRDIPKILGEQRCLDIGCGFGGFVRFLVSCGAISQNIHGVDIIFERLLKAKSCSPAGANLLLGDAARLPYSDASFDLVCQFTVISSIFDPAMRTRICLEMVRVLRKGGYLIWYDMLRTKSTATLPVSLKEIQALIPDLRMVKLHRLHSMFSGRAATITPLFSALLDLLPGLPKTHALILFIKF